MEPGVLLPDGTTPTPVGPHEIDHRGWLMALTAMVVIGLWSLRPAPTPTEPQRIPCDQSEVWMADALPGVGVKTRAMLWHKVRAGDRAGIPQRARIIADEIFIWDHEPLATTATQSSGSALPMHP